MKTIKYFLLIFFLLLNPTFSSAVTITPNGKQVTIDSYGSDLSSTAIAAINYIVDNYYDVEVIQSSQANHGRYNCHFFAWHNNQGYGVWDQDYLWRNGLPSELGWDYYPTDYYTDDDYSAPSGYPSYVSTSSTDAEICVYTSGGEINHSARMLQNSSKVISKWGSYGIYKHDPYECPDGRWVWSPWTGGFYHADYGTITDYYKINPNYRPVGTGDPGGRNWGTIENALDGIPSGGVVSVSGIYTQNSSLTIDNSTLYINPGTTIKFGGYYYLVIKDGGKILAEGTSSNSIIFTSATGTERKSWKAIRVYSSHNRFKQCTFKYGDWALHVKGYPNSASGNVIENCTFRDNDQGLRIEKNNATVKNSRVYENRHGLVCINSTIWFEGNRIYDNDRDGVYSTSSNYLSFKYNVIENNGIGSSSTRNGINTHNLDIIWLGKMYSSVWSGYNTIRDNYNHEIYTSYGNPLVYLNENSVHDDGGYEIYNSTSYCYPAWSCWFGYNGLQSYGCVNESNTLSSPPSWEGSTGPGGALSKSLASGGGGIPGSSGQSDIERIDELKRLISTNPDSPEAVEALFELYSIVRADYATDSFGEKALFYPFLNRIIYNYKDKRIGQLALRFMIIWKMLENDNATVIQLSKEALEILEGEDRMCVLQDLALTYSYTGQIENARIALAEYKETYAFNEDMIELIEEEIKDTDELIAEGLREVESESYLPKVTTTPTPEAFRFLQNYPNPFNPVTTIRYELPKDSFVELRIYDLTGREIRTLVNGNETAGYKNVLWDGKDMFDNPVSSGMYVYKISARSLKGKLQFSQTRKMILLR